MRNDLHVMENFDLEQHLKGVYSTFPEAGRQPVIGLTANYEGVDATLRDRYYKQVVRAGATIDQFFGNNDHPMSQGTRVHQMAMYTIYDAPLQMLADSPTQYLKNQECTDFMVQIPTLFDEVIPLSGELGEYVAVAKRKGTTWYIAAMTNWQARDLTLDLSCLKGLNATADIFADGINADREATDYRHTRLQVKTGDKLNIHLAPGGGWTAILKPIP